MTCNRNVIELKELLIKLQVIDPSNYTYEQLHKIFNYEKEELIKVKII